MGNEEKNILIIGPPDSGKKQQLKILMVEIHRLRALPMEGQLLTTRRSIYSALKGKRV